MGAAFLKVTRHAMTTKRNYFLSMLVMVLTNLFVSESIAQTDLRGSIHLQVLNEGKQAL